LGAAEALLPLKLKRNRTKTKRKSTPTMEVAILHGRLMTARLLQGERSSASLDGSRGRVLVGSTRPKLA